MEIKKYMNNCTCFIVKIDVFRKYFHGTTHNPETLRLVFSYFNFSPRRYVYWLEFSIQITKLSPYFDKL